MLNPTPTPMNRAVCGYTVEANGRDPEYKLRFAVTDRRGGHRVRGEGAVMIGARKRRSEFLREGRFVVVEIFHTDRQSLPILRTLIMDGRAHMAAQAKVPA